MTDYAGLTAIVTGGASGIGAATVDVLSSRGASVAVFDLGTNSAAALSVRCDVSSTAEVEAAMSRVVTEFGGVDVLINNAGIGAVGDVTSNDEEQWRRVFDVNVLGMMRVMRSALPLLSQSAHPAVVMVSSITATVGVPERALYSATKGAVLSLMLAMAADHVGSGIRINAVIPGTVDTPWVARLIDSAADPSVAAEQLRDRQPLGRLVTPTQVALAIAYLASPLSGATTGTALTVDGGMTGLRLPRPR